MSFLIASRGVLAPEDLTIVRNVYDRIVSEPWLPQDPEVQRRCARLVLTIYERKPGPPETLYDLCVNAARQTLSGNGLYGIAGFDK
jgi:hypothetical protein